MGDTESFLASLAAAKPNGQQQLQSAPAQQPMQFAQQPVQQQPMQFAQQPVQQQPMQFATQAPVQQPVQQQPMQFATPSQPMPLMTPPQQFVPPQSETSQAKKQRASKSVEDPWIAFASAALPVLIQANQAPDNAAIIAGQYADSLVREYDKRK